jgi:hypothetical protein
MLWAYFSDRTFLLRINRTFMLWCDRQHVHDVPGGRRQDGVNHVASRRNLDRVDPDFVTIFVEKTPRFAAACAGSQTDSNIALNRWELEGLLVQLFSFSQIGFRRIG